MARKRWNCTYFPSPASNPYFPNELSLTLQHKTPPQNLPPRRSRQRADPTLFFSSSCRAPSTSRDGRRRRRTGGRGRCRRCRKERGSAERIDRSSACIHPSTLSALGSLGSSSPRRPPPFQTGTEKNAGRLSRRGGQGRCRCAPAAAPGRYRLFPAPYPTEPGLNRRVCFLSLLFRSRWGGEGVVLLPGAGHPPTRVPVLPPGVALQRGRNAG